MTGKHGHVRVALFLNGSIGAAVARFFATQDINRGGGLVVGTVIGPLERTRTIDDDSVSLLAPAESICTARLHDPPDYDTFSSWKPDIAIGAGYGFRVREPALSVPPMGIVNLHPSLLPLHRGIAPASWMIYENRGAGVALHYMNDRLDTGDLIARRPVTILPADTDVSLYERLKTALVELLMDKWPSIATGSATSVPQSEFAEPATYHSREDLLSLASFDANSVTADEAIRRLRACSGIGVKLNVDGHAVRARLALETVDSAGDRAR